MTDYLDIETGILYCSIKCAKNSGATKIRPFTETEYEEAYTRDYGNPYGALCPECENEYNSYY